MEFARIQSANDHYADELIKLYLDTFPLSQRHTEESFRNLLGAESDFHCNAVLMNESLVGFFNFWDLDEFVFLEHFAIEPPMRGHKLGEKALLLVRSQTSKPLILEVETEDDNEWSSRRIEFYKRLGFDVIPKEYRQPPYRSDEEYYRLYLMGDQPAYTIENYDSIVERIYKSVYKVPVK